MTGQRRTNDLPDILLGKVCTFRIPESYLPQLASELVTRVRKQVEITHKLQITSFKDGVMLCSLQQSCFL